MFAKYPLLLPKSTSNGENTTVNFVPWHPPLDHRRESKSHASQRTFYSCRRRKRVLSTCKSVSHLSQRRPDSVYVFHAPDISIATSRLLVAVASVWYSLSGTSETFEKPSSHPRTVLPCLCGVPRKSPRPNSRNHRLVHPPGIQLGSPPPRSLWSQVRVG